MSQERDDLIVEVHMTHSKETKNAHRYDLEDPENPYKAAPYLKSFYLPKDEIDGEEADAPKAIVILVYAVV